MTTDRSLEGKCVFVFAATGHIASAFAAAAAQRGATLCLSGRDAHRLGDVSRRVRAVAQTEVFTHVVDAEDQDAVEFYYQRHHVDGRDPDWIFNGIGVDPADAMFGFRSEEVTLDCFLDPLKRIVGSQFTTASLAARRMKARGSGILIILTSSLARSGFPFMAGITAASDAVQGLARVLSAEYEPDGLKVVCARVNAIPSSPTISMTMAANARTMGIPVEQFARSIASLNATGKQLTAEVAANAIVSASLIASSAVSLLPIDIGFA